MNVVVMGAVMILMWALFHGQGHHGSDPDHQRPGPATGQAASENQPGKAPQQPVPIEQGTGALKESQPSRP